MSTEWSLIYYYNVDDVFTFKMFYNRYDNKIAIVFKGTKFTSLADWGENFYAIPCQTYIQHSYIGNRFVYFHCGFYMEYQKERNIIYSVLEQYKSSNPNIIITGHSQGGGIAQFAALDIAIKYSLPKSKFSLITFASPAPGDSDFASLASLLVDHTRIASAWPQPFGVYVDVVVDCLTFYGVGIYYHFGKQYIVESEAYLWGPISLHSMSDSYIPAIRKLMKPVDLAAVYVPYSILYPSQSITDFRQYIAFLDVSFTCTYSLSLISSTGRFYLLQTGSCNYMDATMYIPTTLPTGVYTLFITSDNPLFQMKVYPPTLQIDMYRYAPAYSFVCPSTCRNCSTIDQTCTSCISGYYGSMCAYTCPSKCSACSNGGGSCLTCSNPLSVAPSCDPVVSCPSNAMYVENGVCKCNEGWTGVNCTEILCPVGCASCSSQYQCSACKPGYFGLTCSYQCLPNCASCSSAVSCTRCLPGFYGLTCSSVGYSAMRTIKTFPVQMSPLIAGLTYPVGISYVPCKVDKVATYNSQNAFVVCDDGKTLMRYGQFESLIQPFQKVYNSSYDAHVFTDISLTYNFGILTTKTVGVVFVFGSSQSIPIKNSPTPVLFNTTLNELIVSVKLTDYYSFYMTASGRLYVYGDMTMFYQSGQCINSGVPGRSAFANLTEITFPNNERIKLFDCKAQICFALSTSGNLYGWGKVSKGYYGMNTNLCEYQPILLDSSSFTSEIVAIEANSYFSLFLTKNGYIYYSGIDSLVTLATPSKPQLLLNNPSDPYVRIGTNEDTSFYTVTTRKGKNYVFGGDGSVTQLLNTASASGFTYVSSVDYMPIYGKYLIASTTCYGLFDFDATVCNGNGRCADTDTCVCNQNYAGPQCNVTKCFGVSSDDQRVCSGKGHCSQPNNCTCQAPFTGLNCELYNSTNCPNASSIPYQCQSCPIGSFNPTNLCRDKCLLNCVSCNSSTTCQQCSTGYSGSDCRSYGCPANCMVCSGFNKCSVCKDGYYGPNCEFECRSTCQSCDSNQTCTSCRDGWQGSTCEVPICLQNCKSCNDTLTCTSCIDGFSGSQCFTPCPSSCAACNETFCTACKDGFYGDRCENRQVRCNPFISYYPTMNTRDVGNGELEYTVTITKLFQSNGNFTLRAALENIRNCSSKGAVPSEIVILSTNETQCEWSYTFKVTITSLISDYRVQKSLDSLGNVYTLKVPFYIAMEKPNLDTCQIVNYNINHEIKIVLSSHQYIEMSYETKSITSASFVRDVISVTNKILTIEGRLFLTAGDLQAVNFLYSNPNHQVSFISQFTKNQAGEYYLQLTSNNTISVYSGSFHFELQVLVSNQTFKMELVLDLQYFMPFDPPSTNLVLSTRVSVYSDSFQQVQTSFSITDTPNVLIQLVAGTSSVIPSTIGIVVRNAYLCCMKNGMKMPTFDLSSGQLGCTVYDTANMTAWFQIYQEETPSALLSVKTIKFPMTNFQAVGFTFQLYQNSLPSGTHTCYIHTESKMILNAQSRSIEQEDTSYHAFDILQFTSKEIAAPVDPPLISVKPPKTSSKTAVNGAGVVVGWCLSFIALVLVGLVVM